MQGKFADKLNWEFKYLFLIHFSAMLVLRAVLDFWFCDWLSHITLKHGKQPPFSQPSNAEKMVIASTIAWMPLARTKRLTN